MGPTLAITIYFPGLQLPRLSTVAQLAQLAPIWENSFDSELGEYLAMILG